MNPIIITVIAGVIILLGIVIFPLINRAQFNRMPAEQKVRILMKQAKGLSYFKNVSSGRYGTLYYVKNKRKIYMLPWVLSGGRMQCTRTQLFEKWDYPEEQPAFTEEERERIIDDLINYNKQNRIRIDFHDETNK